MLGVWAIVNASSAPGKGCGDGAGIKYLSRMEKKEKAPLHARTRARTQIQCGLMCGTNGQTRKQKLQTSVGGLYQVCQGEVLNPRHQFHRVLSLPLGQESRVKSRYNDKMRNIANERRTSRSRDCHDNRNPNCSYKLSRDSG